MLESFSALGSLVQTPCGPRKSGMPDSVEMPAPVRTTTRADASTQRRASVMTSAGRTIPRSYQLRVLTGTRRGVYSSHLYVQDEGTLLCPGAERCAAAFVG